MPLRSTSLALRESSASHQNIMIAEEDRLRKPRLLRPSMEATPRAQRASSSLSSAAAQGNTDTPKSAARITPARPLSAVKVPIFQTPQKPLFQRYLLQEVETRPHLTVVLDLDETLVSNRRADLSYAILRPYVLHVLHALRHMKNLEIVLWTASTRETGAPVVDQLQEGGIIFDDVIYRNDMWFTEPVHTKDLRLLGRDTDRVVVFDNAPNCCKLNPHNAVLVEDFMGSRHENDAALVNVYYIVEYLLKHAGEGLSVKESMKLLVEEGHLCRTVEYTLPEAWQRANLRDIPPLRIPPHGKFVRAHTLPPNAQTMKHWTF